jgi:hypothetical protein
VAQGPQQIWTRRKGAIFGGGRVPPGKGSSVILKIVVSDVEEVVVFDQGEVLSLILVRLLLVEEFLLWFKHLFSAFSWLGSGAGCRSGSTAQRRIPLLGGLGLVRSALWAGRLGSPEIVKPAAAFETRILGSEFCFIHLVASRIIVVIRTGG